MQGKHGALPAGRYRSAVHQVHLLWVLSQLSRPVCTSTAAFAGLPCSRVGWCKRLHAACALLGGESPRVLSLPKGLAVRDRLGISEGCSLARVPEAAWP